MAVMAGDKWQGANAPASLPDLPACVLSRLLSVDLSPGSRKQLRLTCKELRQAVNAQVSSVCVDRPGVCLSHFPACELLEVIPWKQEVTESDLVQLLPCLPQLTKLRTIKLESSCLDLPSTSCPPAFSLTAHAGGDAAVAAGGTVLWQRLAGLASDWLHSRQAESQPPDQALPGKSVSCMLSGGAVRAVLAALPTGGVGEGAKCPTATQVHAISVHIANQVPVTFLSTLTSLHTSLRPAIVDSYNSRCSLQATPSDHITHTLATSIHKQHAPRTAPLQPILGATMDVPTHTNAAIRAKARAAVRSPVHLCLSAPCVLPPHGPRALLMLGTFGFIAELRLEVPPCLLARPGCLGHLAGCSALQKLDISIMAHAASSAASLPAADLPLAGQEPQLDQEAEAEDPLPPEVSVSATGRIMAQVTAAAGLGRLSRLVGLDSLTLRGEVTVSQCGVASLAVLTGLASLTLWLKTHITDEALAVLSQGCSKLRTLQLARLELEQRPFEAPLLPQVNTLTLYVESCHRRVATSFPNISTAVLRDWPAVTDPDVLQGLTGLTSLTLMQHSSCRSQTSPNCPLHITAHVSALATLTSIKSLVYKGFLQSHHLGPLLVALHDLPLLHSLSLIAASSAEPAALASPSKASKNEGPILQGLCIKDLSLNAQGTAWEASKLLSRAELPNLQSLCLLNQAQPVSTSSLATGLRGMPRLGLLEMRACSGVDAEMVKAVRCRVGACRLGAKGTLHVVWGVSAAAGAQLREEVWEGWGCVAPRPSLLCGLPGSCFMPLGATGSNNLQ